VRSYTTLDVDVPLIVELALLVVMFVASSVPDVDTAVFEVISYTKMEVDAPLLVELSPIAKISVVERERDDETPVIKVLSYSTLDVNEPTLVEMPLFVVLSLDPSISGILVRMLEVVVDDDVDVVEQGQFTGIKIACCVYN
jgi:hypothetical protein